MAEMLAVVGVAASIAQLVDISVRISSWLKDFSSTASDAPTYCSSLLVQIEALTVVLHRIEERTKHTNPQTEFVSQLQRLINTTTGQVKSLERQLKAVIPKQDASRSRRTWSALRGALSENAIRKLSDDINHSINILTVFSSETQMLRISQLQAEIASNLTNERELSRDIIKLELSHQTGRIQHSLDKLPAAVLASLPNQNPLTKAGEIEQVTISRVQKWINGLLSDEDLTRGTRQRTKDTCNWIFERDVFVNWMSPPSTDVGMDVLWLRGGPGFGKTILCASIVQYLQQHFPSQVAYFFCVAGEEAKSRAPAILRSWVAQTIEQNKSALQVAREAYLEMHGHQGRMLTETNLRAIFIRICKQLSTPFFIVDGYDECNKHHIFYPNRNNEALEFLEDLLDIAPQASCKVLFVSREDADLRSELPRLTDMSTCQFREYEIAPSDTLIDLRTFSDAVMTSKLRGRTQDLKMELAKLATERSQGMFLWVEFLARRLHKDKNTKELRTLISETPVDLRQTYERELRRVLTSEDDRERAISILRWTLFAVRPLTVRELVEALAIEFNDDSDLDHYPYDNLPDSWDKTDITGRIRRLCGSLITIDESEDDSEGWQNHTVKLAHFSVREFLLTARDVAGLPPGKSLFPDLHTEHRLISRSCLQYLLYQEVGNSSFDNEQQIRDHLKKFAFFNYADSGLPHHLRESGPAIADLISNLNHFFDPDSARWILWAGVIEMKSSGSDVFAELAFLRENPWSVIVYIVTFGIMETLQYLQKHKNFDSNARSMKGVSPLAAAASQNALDMLSFLLKHEARVNVKDSLGVTPLFEAAHYGHSDAVRMLCVHGADVNLQNNDIDQTSLHVASFNGHESVVQILLDYGAQIDARSSALLGANALHLAAAGNHTGVVTCLLATKQIDVDVSDKMGHTPLFHAIVGKHLNMVKCLVEVFNASLTIRDNSDHTPLLAAARDGDLEIFKYLFRLQDVPLHTMSPISPQVVAASNGHSEILKYLFEQGPNQQVDDNETLAFAAARSNNIESFEYLLRQLNIDICHQNKDGKMLLHEAASEGNSNVVQYILSKIRVDDTRRIDFVTVVNAAQHGYINNLNLYVPVASIMNEMKPKWQLLVWENVGQRYRSTIETILKQQDLKLIEVGTHGMTMIHVAAMVGDVAMFEFIVERHPDLLMLEDEAQLTPLHRAVMFGRIGIIKLIIKEKAGALNKSSMGSTYLAFATMSNQVAMMKFLMKELSLEIDAIIDGTWSLLHVAAFGGAVEAAKFCIEHASVDLCFQDPKGMTPFMLAIYHDRLLFVQAFWESHDVLGAIKTKAGITASHVAAAGGANSVLKFLSIQQHDDLEARDDEGRTPLHFAATFNKIETVEFLRKAGVDSESRDNEKQTAIFAGVKVGSLEVIQYFLDHDMGLRDEDIDLNTPLHVAAGFDQVEVVSCLLQRGADIEAKNIHKHTPLRIAVDEGHTGVLKVLLDHNASVDVTSEDGWTPLMASISKGHKSIFDVLICRPHINVNCYSEDGLTPLHVAIDHGHFDMFQELLQHGAQPDVSTEEGHTALHYAVSRCQSDMVEELLKRGVTVDTRSQSRWTPLLQAASSGHKHIVQLLLTHNAEVNAATDNGQTSLHLSTSADVTQLLLQTNGDALQWNTDGLMPIHYAAISCDFEIIVVLIDHCGATHATARTMDGRYPIHLAAEKGHTELCQLLMQYDATIDHQDDNGYTPLHYAVEFAHLATVKFLIQNHADINIRNNQGVAIVHMATRSGSMEMIHLMREELMADMTVSDDSHSTCLHFAAWAGHSVVMEYLLLQSNLSSTCDNFGRTPLHCACAQGDLSVVQLLIKHRPDVEIDSKTKAGETPLFYAAWSGHLAVVKLMIDMKADVSTVTNNGDSNIFVAAQYGRLDVLQYLCSSHGDQIHARNAANQTSLYIASYMGHTEVVRFLIEQYKSQGIHDLQTRPEHRTDGWTAMHAAAEKGHTEILKLLLSWRPLDCLIDNDIGYTPINLAAQEGKCAAVEILWRSNAESSARYEKLMTPLHAAVINGHIDVVKHLLILFEDKAMISNINHQMRWGQTPLHVALRNRSYEIIILLADHGADLSIPDGNGHSIVDWASQDPVLARILGSRCAAYRLTEKSKQSLILCDTVLDLSRDMLHNRQSQSDGDYPKWDILGRCLIFLGDLSAASTAFNNRIYVVVEKSETDQIVMSTLTHSASCDGCKQPIKNVRYVCTQCPNGDLCADCKTDPSKSKHPESCVNHVFFPIEPASAIENSEVPNTISDEAAKWLEELITQYESSVEK